MQTSPIFVVTCALAVACGNLHGRTPPDAGQGGAPGSGGTSAHGGSGGITLTFTSAVGGATGGARTATGGACSAAGGVGGAATAPGGAPRACPDSWQGAVMAL